MGEEKKLKFLVFAPEKFASIVMSFPFLMELSRESNVGEINVICHPKYRPLFTLLEGSVRTFDFDEKEHSGAMGIHKYCYNLKDVFNIDHYFALGNSFTSAFMGFCFQATHRYGPKENMQDLFFTQKWERGASEHQSFTYLNLLKLFTQKDYAELKVLGPEVPPYFPDWRENRYSVLHLDRHVIKGASALVWADFLNHFENQKFVFVGDDEDREEVEKFVATLDKSNQYLNLCGKTSPFDLAKVLSFAQGFLGKNSGPAHLASFLGVKVAIWEGPQHALDLPSYTRVGHNTLNLQGDLTAVADEIYRLFELS